MDGSTEDSKDGEESTNEKLYKTVKGVQSVIEYSARSNNVPGARWGQSMCLISDSTVLMVGGQGERNLLLKDSVWLLNLDVSQDKFIWTQPEISYQTNTSAKPDIRMGHTVVYDPMLRSVYVYGGSKNKKWFNDLQVLDIDAWKWTHVQGTSPQRAYHSCTLYCHELWVFGGTMPGPDRDQEVCTNEICVYNPFTENWFYPDVTGSKPLRRSGHSSTLMGHKMFMFGGWEAPVCYNDVHMLDIRCLEWTKVTINGPPPIPRSWHAACAISDNRILVHGGYSGQTALSDMLIFDTRSLSWTEVLLEPKLTCRTGHQCLCLPRDRRTADKDVVLIFGGGDNEQKFFSLLQSVTIPLEIQAKHFR